MICFMYFLIPQRKGWPEKASTWEPLKNLRRVRDFIDAFEKRYTIVSFSHLLYIHALFMFIHMKFTPFK